MIFNTFRNIKKLKIIIIIDIARNVMKRNRQIKDHHRRFLQKRYSQHNLDQVEKLH